MYPVNGRMTWDVMFINHDGPSGRSNRVASGQFPLPGEIADRMAWFEAVECVLDNADPRRQPPAPPLGDMVEQLTLDLDFSP